ncbi:threonylcarbamoyladenosine tRNA methylthiotransferase [Archaeoglobales archaeon ex4484_92]|nr:MAG: threonylcarbamoyladenosine tRNA methylthiotransferase [Archaeoglobales archaeon ex4484_92]
MRVHIETYGCTRDAEMMEALLFRAGYEIAGLDSADYVVVNTCAVKDPTEKHMARRIKELLDSGKRVIVTGCLPHVNPSAIDDRVSGILGVKSIDRIVEAIELAERGKKLISVEGWRERSIDKLELPRVWKGGVVFIVPISEGCLNACTYCATRFARGVLKSYKAELIMKWVKEAVATYTLEEFEEIVREFRKHIKDLNLNTDIIVGFPGESEEAFQNTVKLIKRVRPDKINVSRFSPRPGTPAAKMRDQIVGWKVKERSRYLHRLRLSISYEINRRYVDKEIEVLTHGEGKKGGIEGRTMNYKDIILPEAPVGEFVNAKVTKATSTYLLGELVD